MVSTVTFVPGCFSFSCSAISSAFSSKGFMMDSTPSRTSVLVSGLIRTCVVLGTCLTHTTICISYSSGPAARAAGRAVRNRTGPRAYFLATAPYSLFSASPMMSRWIWLVPS